MRKLVIVINGSAGVGKDTICRLIGGQYHVMNISSVDPIKKIAADNGWDGRKDEKSRKFLADLKQLFVDFNDLPQKYLLKKYRDFLQSDQEILFVHIREPEEIAKFKNSVGEGCVTLLVRGRDAIKRKWNNSADADVENYQYDFYYQNDKPLDELKKDVIAFFEREILK